MGGKNTWIKERNRNQPLIKSWGTCDSADLTLKKKTLMTIKNKQQKTENTAFKKEDFLQVVEHRKYWTSPL